MEFLLREGEGRQDERKLHELETATRTGQEMSGAGVINEWALEVSMRPVRVSLQSWGYVPKLIFNASFRFVFDRSTQRTSDTKVCSTHTFFVYFCPHTSMCVRPTLVGTTKLIL